MEPDRKIIKQYFYNNDIRFVRITSENNLMIFFENKEKDLEWKNETEWTSEEKQIYHYLKKQNKTDLIKKDIETWTDISISVLPKSSTKPPNWPLIISLIVVGIILLVGLIVFVKKKKK